MALSAVRLLKCRQADCRELGMQHPRSVGAGVQVVNLCNFRGIIA
jgi:hypothetical protein